MAIRNEIDAAARGRTVCSVFLDTAAAHGSAVAVREWDPGVTGGWASVTYAGMAEQVARAAAGFKTLGLQPGDRVVLMLRNRIAFRVADLAVLFAGGTPVSIYSTSSAEQVGWLAAHCRASMAVLDGPDELARFDAAGPDLPLLRHRVVVDGLLPAGSAGSAGTLAWSELLDAEPLDLGAAATSVRPDDLATVIYTSGTTGSPKGVMISHSNLVWTMESHDRAYVRRPPGYRTVSYLPMAHIAERTVSYYEAIASAYEVTCCPALAEVGTYVGQTRPQLLFGVPRVWEKLKSGAEAAAAAGDPGRAAGLADAVRAALPLRLRARDGELDPEGAATLEQLDALAFKGLRQGLGLDDCDLPVTSAAPIPRSVIEWFLGIGVPLFEVYGMSEATGPITSNVDGRQPGTVGRPMPGCEVRLAEDGEVLVRGGNVFVGYLDDPVLTAATVDDGGWLCTGDIGVLDDGGRLRIIDRKKELFITAGGENISPANLEAALSAIPLVGQACALGEGRPYPVALLVLDPDAAGTWAAAHGRPGATLADLATDPTLRAELEVAVEAAMEPFGRPQRVKRFAVLTDEWLPDSDVLTPTLKLRRRRVLERYAPEIDALYA